MKILINGICGKMGRNLYNYAKSLIDVAVVEGVDTIEKIGGVKIEDFSNVKLLSNIFESEKSEVVIDFSSPKSLDNLLKFCKLRKLPLVLATTGYTSFDEKKIFEASRYIPILKCFNFSYGMQVVLGEIKNMSQKLKDYDIEILETHHNKKEDVPSGTAISMFNEVSISRPLSIAVVGRNGNSQKRLKNEVGIHSIRGGGVIGEHTIKFMSENEVITLTHTAFSKDIYSSGAIFGARKLQGKPNGLYSLIDLM